MKPADDWPKSKTAVRLIKLKDGPLDDLGRCSFTLLWWQDGKKRAQCFFAKPWETQQSLREAIKRRAMGELP